MGWSWRNFNLSTAEKFLGNMFVDTHCHLDMVFSREGHRGTYKEFREKNERSWSAAYESCITDFCCLDVQGVDHMKAMEKFEKLLTEDGVYGAFGCHPHVADKYEELNVDDALDIVCNFERLVAVGECGLDYSHKNRVDHEVQKKVFVKQIKKAVQKDKALVVHCRDAQEDCLKILLDNAPDDLRIHLHCFTSDFEAAKPWLDAFSNLYIGFTPLIVNPSKERRKVLDAVKKIDLSRVLIETDAPFFVPPHYKEEPYSKLKGGHPGLAVTVALKFAELRNVDPVAVLQQIRQNTSFVYRI